MRYLLILCALLIALLLAGAAWGFVVYSPDELPPESNYQITIYGNEEAGYIVQYEWTERIFLRYDGISYIYRVNLCSIAYEVDSFADIRPTPAEMENGR